MLEIPPTPDSAESIAFVENCLQNCIVSHSTCATEHSFVPKRLLKFSDAGCNIVELDDLVPYIALSYCWGGSLPLKTLKENFLQHAEHIEWNRIPQCFRDAADVAQRLGIQHLWIDSLCIIQDDQHDWEDQFPQMASIYENAYVVVGAASISDCHQSFLDGEKNSRPKAITIDSAHPNQPAPVMVRKVPTTGLHEDYESFYGARDPLDKRAWTLQERLLATRFLGFSTAELQWSCRMRSNCEGGHQDSPNRQFHSLYSIDTCQKAFHFWHDQVMEFSKRQLSFPSDKLPAISGVASKISGIISSEYIAGLWRNNLIRDMCWERHMFQSVKWQATAAWRAPTFSWVSVEGNIFYNDQAIAGNGTYVSEVIDAHCTLLGSSPFGQVVDGFVEIRGPLLQASLTSDPAFDPSDRKSRNNPNAMLSPSQNDTSSLFTARTGEWRILFRSDTHLASGPIVPSPNEPPSRCMTAYRVTEEKSENIKEACAWILVVGYWYEYVSNPDGQRWVTIIILGRSARVPGAFERLGFQNIAWPPLPGELSAAEMARLNTPVQGKGEKTCLKIV